jgi:hypothetical protein
MRDVKDVVTCELFPPPTTCDHDGYIAANRYQSAFKNLASASYGKNGGVGPSERA